MKLSLFKDLIEATRRLLPFNLSPGLISPFDRKALLRTPKIIIN